MCFVLLRFGSGRFGRCAPQSKWKGTSKAVKSSRATMVIVGVNYMLLALIFLSDDDWSGSRVSLFEF